MTTFVTPRLFLSLVIVDLTSHVTGFPFLYHVPRAEDGTPLETVVKELSDKLTQLTAQLQAQDVQILDLKAQLASVTQPVAFTVTFADPEKRELAENQILRFDNVLYNAGDGYNAQTGVFTAPSAGSYAFYIHVTRHPSDTDNCVEMDLYYGQQQVTTASAYVHHYHSGSNMVTLRLAKGDTVHAQMKSSTMVFGGVHTSVSGLKLD